MSLSLNAHGWEAGNGMMHNARMKPFSGFVGIAFFALVATSCNAHAPGEEYTYLNMFRHKEQLPDMPPTNIYRSVVYEDVLAPELVANPKIARRRLHSHDSSEDTPGLPSQQSNHYVSRTRATEKLHTRRHSRRPLQTDRYSNHEYGDEEGEDDAEWEYEDEPLAEPEQQDDEPPSQNIEVKPRDESVRLVDYVRVSADDKDRKKSGPGPGDDIKRVSYMLLKLLKQYKATSLVDVPCRAHSSWMPHFLDKVQKEIPKLKYTCVDSSKEFLDAAKKRLKHKAHAKYVLRRFWNEEIPKADFVLSWSGLDKMRSDNVFNFLKNIGTSGNHKYIILGSHLKGSKLADRKLKAVNFREEPFLLAKPMRVVSRVSVAPVKKQMYIYKVEDMRESWDPEP